MWLSQIPPSTQGQIERERERERPCGQAAVVRVTPLNQVDAPQLTHTAILIGPEPDFAVSSKQTPVFSSNS